MIGDIGAGLMRRQGYNRSAGRICVSLAHIQHTPAIQVPIAIRRSALSQ